MQPATGPHGRHGWQRRASTRCVRSVARTLPRYPHRRGNHVITMQGHQAPPGRTTGGVVCAAAATARDADGYRPSRLQTIRGGKPPRDVSNPSSCATQSSPKPCSVRRLPRLTRIRRAMPLAMVALAMCSVWHNRCNLSATRSVSRVYRPPHNMHHKNSYSNRLFKRRIVRC